VKKQNTPTRNTQEQAAKLNWLRVLDLGAEAFNENANEQSRPAKPSSFVVLP
jgi:hypothetical protein